MTTENLPPEEWRPILSPIRYHVLDLIAQMDNRRSQGQIIYPPQNQIFRALELTPPHKTKVIIIGQDPYHGPGQANGLAFSVNPGVNFPPSLQNIFKELQSDIGCPMPTSGDLTPWAKQGVLLLNTSLSVIAGQPGSLMDVGWDEVVAQAINGVLYHRRQAGRPSPVFIVWGAKAHAFLMRNVRTDLKQNLRVLYSTHPSPFSATKPTRSAPAFMGSRPFSSTNKLLWCSGDELINWQLP